MTFSDHARSRLGLSALRRYSLRVALSILVSSYALAQPRVEANVGIRQVPAAVASSCPSPPQTYTVTDLGSFGDFAVPSAINNKGQIVGSSGDESGIVGGKPIRAFLWQDGRMTDLGTLPGDINSWAAAVNDSAQVVGRSHPSERGFIWQNGQIAAGPANPTALNNKGQIAGANYVWYNGTATQLVPVTTPFQGFMAKAINNNGLIAGQWTWDLGAYDLREAAAIWSAGVATNLTYPGAYHEDPAAVPYADATTLNDSGQVVYSIPDAGVGGTRTFLWESGYASEIGAFSPERINACGQIVGTARRNAHADDNNYGFLDSYAVIWSAGKTYDLNALIPPNSGWVLKRAHALNDAGQIVGEGTVAGNATPIWDHQHAFLLTPVGPAPSVPLIGLIANAADELPTISPNTWVEIKGMNLAAGSQTWSPSGQMPTQLAGVSATVNGKSAYISYVSPTQVNILTPPDAIQGMVTVQLINNGLSSEPISVLAQSTTPSFFLFSDGSHAAARHSDGSPIGATALFQGLSTPARPGETIALYGNGFGPTSVPVVRGSAMQSGTLSTLPVIKVGGSPATVTYAGLVGPGLFQFNVVVPSDVGDGDNFVTAMYNGVATQFYVLLTVKR